MEADSHRLGGGFPSFVRYSKPDPATESVPVGGGPPDLALHLAEVPGDSPPVLSAAITNEAASGRRVHTDGAPGQGPQRDPSGVRLHRQRVGAGTETAHRLQECGHAVSSSSHRPRQHPSGGANTERSYFPPRGSARGLPPTGAVSAVQRHSIATTPRDSGETADRLGSAAADRLSIAATGRITSAAIGRLSIEATRRIPSAATGRIFIAATGSITSAATS